MIMNIQARYLREHDTVIEGARERNVSRAHVEYDGLVRVDFICRSRSWYESDEILMIKRGEK